MFYKFNNMIGRIAPATQTEAYVPQGLNPLSKGPSVIVFDTKLTKIAQEPAVMGRGASAFGSVPEVTSAALGEGLGVVPANPRYMRIMQMQNMFLADDGKLVWQKLPRDRIFYLGTLGVTLVGTVLSLTLLYKMAYPKLQSED